MPSHLENLPASVLKSIISYLSFSDVLNLSSTCHSLYNICNSNDVWRLMFKQYFMAYCSQECYERFLQHNVWKLLCYEIFKQYEYYHIYCQSEEAYESDAGKAYVAELKHSTAHTNLLDCRPSSYDKDDVTSASDSSESIDEIINVTELHRSISACSYESFQWLSQSSSKVNLNVAPSSSANDVEESSHHYVNYVPTRANGHDALNLGFTREQLMKRLRNLVKMAFKNFNGDVESLYPATKNGKYSLSYRNDKNNDDDDVDGKQ